MFHKIERLNVFLCTVLYGMALLFVAYGFVKIYRGEDAIAYFLLGGCFAIISTGKKIWDKKKENDTEA